MKCRHCGGSVARLVECYRELELGANDELIEKRTTHIYLQCNRDGCRYTWTEDIEVEETTLPYQAVFD